MPTTPRIEGFDVPDGFDPLQGFVVPFNDLLGMEWDLMSPERWEAHIDIDAKHLQPYGQVHGGVFSSLVEAIGSAAAGARVLQLGKGVVGVHNSTHFIRPVRDGRIDAVATPIHVGRTQQLWLIEITRSDGKVCARGELRLQVIDMPGA